MHVNYPGASQPFRYQRIALVQSRFSFFVIYFVVCDFIIIEGIQVRSVYCYRSDGWSPHTATTVDFEDCDVNNMTMGSNQCSLPCLNECVLSEWSIWGHCESKMGLRAGHEGSCLEATRRRSRVVLRQPSPVSGILTYILL